MPKKKTLNTYFYFDIILPLSTKTSHNISDESLSFLYFRRQKLKSKLHVSQIGSICSDLSSNFLCWIMNEAVKIIQTLLEQYKGNITFPHRYIHSNSLMKSIPYLTYRMSSFLPKIAKLCNLLCNCVIILGMIST